MATARSINHTQTQIIFHPFLAAASHAAASWPSPSATRGVLPGDIGSMGRGKRGNQSKKGGTPADPQSQVQPTADDVDLGLFLTPHERAEWLVQVVTKQSPVLNELRTAKQKLAERMKRLMEDELPAVERSTKNALERAQNLTDPRILHVTFSQIVSGGAHVRTKVCLDAFHECQVLMMDSMIWAAMETATQHARIMEVTASRSRRAQTETETVTCRIAKVSSEVSKLAEQLADLREAVADTRTKLDECNLRLSLLSSDHFVESSSRGRFAKTRGPRPTSRSSTESHATSIKSIEERIDAAQQEARRKRRGGTGVEIHHPAASSSASSLATLPESEPLVRTPVGSHISGVSQCTYHIPAGLQQMPVRSVGCFGGVECVGVVAFPGESPAPRALGSLRRP